MSNYDALLEALKEARETEEKAKASLKSALDALKSSEGYVLMTNMHEVAHSAVEEIEKKLREIAYTEWLNTQNKHPHEKIEVKIFPTFKIIDPEVLRKWVFDKLADALIIDMKKVENYAIKIGPVGGAEKGEQARVQIASKL